MIRLALLFILLTQTVFLYSQSQKEINSRFQYNENYIYGAEHITLPTAVDISNSKLDSFQKEKIQFYINYFLNEKNKELEQGIFKQGIRFSYKGNPLLAQLGISLSGFEGNYFNLSFLIAARFGLKMDALVDERYDFDKSYKASQLWMKVLSKQYDTPEEIVLAFINTPGGLNRAKIRAKSNKLEDYYTHLPEKTKNIYFIQLAIGEILSRTKIQNNEMFYHHSHSNQNFKEMVVKKEFDLKVLEVISKIKKEEIKLQNPTLITDIIPAKFILKYYNKDLPKLIDSVYFYQDSILDNPNYGVDEKDTTQKTLAEVYYRVNKGDNLLMISNWYALDLKNIQVWNKLSNDDIFKGQVLKLWVDEDLAFDLSKINFLSLEAKNELLEYTSFQEELKNYKYYTVQKGDALWLISQNYKGVSADDIMKWNGISENIEIGQKILIKIEN